MRLSRDKIRKKFALIAMSLTTAIVGLVLYLTTLDGRSYRRSPSKKSSTRVSEWYTVEQDDKFNTTYYVDQFRCTKDTFNRICDLIKVNWDQVNRPIPKRAIFSLRQRVALTLHYFAHEGSISQSARSLGMGKASAVRFINEVQRVLVGRLSKQYIKMPSTASEWEVIKEGFQRKRGFPGVVGAVDGTLLERERPYDHEGWYCRKGYPAYNVQLVVDHRHRVMSFCSKPGSLNDQSVWNYSKFGNTITDIIPAGTVILGDAGYKLLPHLMTPYDAWKPMSSKERNYNLIHSSTRMTVEIAIGRIKGRFRRLKVPLAQKTTAAMNRVVHSILVLHNLTIEFNDSFSVDLVSEDSGGLPDRSSNEISDNQSERAKNVRSAIANYLQ